MSYVAPAKRPLLIAGLRDIAAFLAANTDVPAPYGAELMVFPPRDTDAAMCVEIDRIAALIGSPVVDERAEYEHYRTALSFGPVTYAAVAILADARARYDALMSYDHAVMPDTPTAPNAMGER